MKYYYTFGTDTKFPYQKGWVEVRANNWDEAHNKFKKRFGEKAMRHENTLNCAFFYDESRFNPSQHNLGEYCHEVIE